ncbi:MAG TPA: hypothetical protein DCP89_02075 [Acidimicrobiaceae bacterium]|jgi:hypothetical protein|nr:hypothetical protein [Actinomycetota bacterium]MCH1614877.1 hypothetical protein [Acidimicrobiales bacterium]HAN07265.1 hypothetical protein [Acidimicrobiaceae bacterium]MDG1197723.1 hypothetical protein [Actinomycetota bacterium]MDG2120126.1 hypothetical protein [Actinomycetota bacterium]|tara:strand:+ start:772 stop:963 length:192 start_codon:yes stop_codon:yes gene_type:complete
MVTKAELSSIETAVQELGERLVASADELLGTINENVAVDLYEVDRSLRMARRRLSKAAEGLKN